MKSTTSEAISRCLTTTLLIQLALAFFAPPIPIGDHFLFASDLAIFAWTPIFFVLAFRESGAKARKRLLIATLFLLTLFSLAFLHGMARPILPSDFYYLVGGPKDAAFRFTKEGFVAFRFFVWCTAALVVSRLAPDVLRMKRGLGILAGIAALTMIGAHLSPEVRAWLGSVYQYDPDASPWADRVYGCFRSPIEAGVTLCFAFLLLARGEWARPSVKFSTLATIGTGIVLARTLSGGVGLFIAFVYALVRAKDLPSSSEKPIFGHRTVKWIIAISVAFAIAFIALRWNSEFLASKRANFIFRFRPWAFYREILAWRIDYFLLGIGFHPHFTDNIYLFIFSRSGLVGFGAAVGALTFAWRNRALDDRPWGEAIVIFFLISGLVVDNLILRPVAYLFIACAICSLKGPKISSQA